MSIYFPRIVLTTLQFLIYTVSMSENINLEIYITVADAAREYGVSPESVRSAIYKKQVPSIMWLRQHLMLKTDVEQWRANVKRGRPRKAPTEPNGGDPVLEVNLPQE